MKMLKSVEGMRCVNDGIMNYRKILLSFFCNVFFFKEYDNHRDLHRVDRRQRQMCIRVRCSLGSIRWGQFVTLSPLLLVHHV